MERRLLRRVLGGQFIHCRLAGIEAFVLDSEFYLHDPIRLTFRPG